MTRTNQLTSPHLRPPTADLNRLLAGEHHDPHSILGAHEYGDHTAARAPPTLVQVVALVGGERYVFSHIESGLFAVALPFTNLADYRLEISYEGGGDSPTRTWWPMRTGSAHARRGRLAPVRGSSRTTVGGARRASARLHHTRRRGERGVVRGVGAERPGSA